MTEATTQILTGCTEEVYEFLHNVIQEAQATGAVVHIITIIPSGSSSDTGDRQKGCNPGDTTCPKT
jgi:hypothetical protein